MRKRESTVADAIPPAVEVVPGDIGDPAACRAAVDGVDKVRRRDNVVSHVTEAWRPHCIAILCKILP